MALALAPPPQSDPPPASAARLTHPALAAEELLDVDAMQKILDAFSTFSTEIRADIAAVSSKVDVAAARETAAKDRADRLEKDVEKLKEGAVDARISVVKITAWAAGVAAAVSAFGFVIALILKAH